MQTHTSPINHIRLSSIVKAYIEHHYAVNPKSMLREFQVFLRGMGMTNPDTSEVPMFSNLRYVASLGCFNPRTIKLVLANNGIDISKENSMVLLDEIK